MNELVSVILPVYNGSKYISDAIDSVLNQSYSNFELIIIDDCSTDDTLNIVKNYNDRRIKIIHNTTNQGIVYSLNKGIMESKGEYIARMDADDICLPERLEKQIKYMKSHRNVIISSCWFETFGSSSAVVKYPEKHKIIFPDLLFGNRFLHPGFFIDAQLFNKFQVYYDENMKLVEDYDLIERASQYGDLANVPHVLMKYRIHDNQTTSKYRNKQHILGSKIRKRLLNRIGINLSDKDTKIFETVCFLGDYSKCNYDVISSALNIYLQIINNNKKYNVFDYNSLNDIIAKKVFSLLKNSLYNNIINSKEYHELCHRTPFHLLKIKLFASYILQPR